MKKITLLILGFLITTCLFCNTAMASESNIIIDGTLNPQKKASSSTSDHDFSKNNDKLSNIDVRTVKLNFETLPRLGEKINQWNFWKQVLIIFIIIYIINLRICKKKT